MARQKATPDIGNADSDDKAAADAVNTPHAYAEKEERKAEQDSKSETPDEKNSHQNESTNEKSERGPFGTAQHEGDGWNDVPVQMRG